MTHDILETLNPVQKQAVLYLDSPLLIIAGAGSGKTKVITNKIAHLVREHDYPPYSILGVTFTNKAAAEMRRRIHTLTGIDEKEFNVFTFHALGLRILRQSGAETGYDASWQVIDDSDQKSTLNRIIKENFSRFTTDMRDTVKRKIGFAKMELNYPNDKEGLFQKGFDEDEVRIFSLYYQFQKENKSWDYEDLVSLPVKLLQTNERLRDKYRDKFRYVVVDEFQDTNPNQYELVRLIAGGHKQVTIVGDDDQAIYSWRGASIRFLSEFKHHFPGTKTIKLEQNYRSTPQVLDFANNVITRNTQRNDKAMWTEQEDGNPVYVLNTKTKEDEASAVADYILRLKEQNPEIFPLAILYRINSQSLPFETEFSRRRIDFQILKGQRFFDRREIKDCLALLKLTLNIEDDLSFLRVIDFLALGIGAKTLDALTASARKNLLSLFEALKTTLPDKFGAKPLFAAIDTLNQRKAEYKLSEILTLLLKHSKYQTVLAERGEDSRLLNIQALSEFIVKWETDNPGENFNQFLDRISLDAGERDTSESGETPVYLLTMHNAKGLEFPTVVAVGINASYMPFFMREGREELEEERRLLYVAATRAIQQLVVSTGGDRESKFLTQVNRALYSNVYSVDGLFGYRASSGFGDTLPESGILQEEQEERYLEHPIFGRGRIVNALDNDRYIVDFVDRGEKTIDTSVVPVTFL